MMAQYLKIKSQYQDTLLFFRLGDFMNVYDDAIEASVLITLRDDAKKTHTYVRCSISFSFRIQKLISKGYKVASVSKWKIQLKQKVW